MDELEVFATSRLFSPVHCTSSMPRRRIVLAEFQARPVRKTPSFFRFKTRFSLWTTGQNTSAFTSTRDDAPSSTHHAGAVADLVCLAVATHRSEPLCWPFQATRGRLEAAVAGARRRVKASAVFPEAHGVGRRQSVVSDTPSRPLAGHREAAVGEIFAYRRAPVRSL